MVLRDVILRSSMYVLVYAMQRMNDCIIDLIDLTNWTETLETNDDRSIELIDGFVQHVSSLFFYCSYHKNREGDEERERGRKMIHTQTHTQLFYCWVAVVTVEVVKPKQM